MEAQLQKFLVDDLKKVEHHVNQLIDNIIASGRLEDFSKDIEEVEEFFNYWRHHATPNGNDKEISLICCVIQREGLINGTLFQNFDKVFRYAKLFYEEYNNHDWEKSKIDFDEAVVLFVNNKKREEQQRKDEQWKNIF